MTSSSAVTTRSDSKSMPPLGNRLRDPTEIKTQKNRDIVPASGNQLRDLSVWFKEFSIKGDTPKHFLEFRCGTSCKSGIEEAQNLHSISERPNLRNTQENQDYGGSLQETRSLSSTSSRKLWWLDISRSQSSQ